MLNAVIPGLVDPAGRGGGIVDRRQGTDPPGGGCKGQRPWPREMLHFWTQFARFGAGFQHYVENLLIYFQ